jgi:anti-sigma B factor antagonist
MDMQLNIVSNDGGVVRVQAGGQITQGALAANPEPLGVLLGEGGYGRRVALSLADATFLDSSGMGWLLLCNKRFREADGRLVIHSVPPVVLDVMKVMRLDRVLKLAEDEVAALAML